MMRKINLVTAAIMLALSANNAFATIDTEQADMETISVVGKRIAQANNVVGVEAVARQAPMSSVLAAV